MQYYTLEEAAKILGLDLGEVKRMAERNELRAFRDRGTLRFRKPEVDELARRRGMATNPAIGLDGMPARPAEPPAGPPSAARSAASHKSSQFEIGASNEEVDFGEGLLVSESGSKPRPPSSSKVAASPRPRPGSDSDVRLVADGSNLDFHIADDGAAPPGGPSSGTRPKSSMKRPSQVGRPQSKLVVGGAPQRPSQIRRPASRLDSDVRLVPPADSGDSGVRTSGDSGPRRGGQEARPGKSPSSSVFHLEEAPPLLAPLPEDSGQHARDAGAAGTRRSNHRPRTPRRRKSTWMQKCARPVHHRAYGLLRSNQPPASRAYHCR